ncbi:H/ACA ribonucleoprotein complex non-core subunit NAF1 [Discoglossus pictus]
MDTQSKTTLDEELVKEEDNDNSSGCGVNKPVIISNSVNKSELLPTMEDDNEPSQTGQILNAGLLVSVCEEINGNGNIKHINEKTEEQMEVATQLESLSVQNGSVDVSCEDIEETDQLHGNTCAQVSVTVGDKTTDSAAEIEDRSSEDSSSDSDTESSSSSSSSAMSAAQPVDDEDECFKNNDVPLKTKGELLINELPSVEELSIILPDDVELKPFGTISSIIEQLVIIESLKDVPPIHEDSVIFKENRHAVGKIFEIFGPVPHPFYVIRFNSKEHIESKTINIKDTMYFAPTFEDCTQYIIPDKLKERGSDASWANDLEPPPDALEFSDDEKEREAKQKKKAQNLVKKKSKCEQDETSSSTQEQSQPYGRQHHSRRGYGPRFSRGRGSQLQENSFGYNSGQYFQTGFSGPHVMQQPYHLSNSHNGQGPPMQHYYGPNFGDFHHFPTGPPPPLPPQPHGAWPGPYIQNSPFFPPPPPPPPPGNSNHSQFGPHY